MSSLLEQIAGLRAHCAAIAVADGPVIAAGFVTGLIGSLTHCAGMCGPIVAAQSLELAASETVTPSSILAESWQRLRRATLLPYQAGRSTTYMALGALVATPVGLSSFWKWLDWLPPFLLVLTSAMFFATAARQLGLWRPLAVLANRLGNWPSRLLPGRLGPVDSVLHIAAPLLRNPVGIRGYLLGVMLGFLPCGLLYAALFMAASTGSPLAAAFAMLAFALGTFPLSWAVAFGSRMTAGRFREKARIPLALLTLFNGVMLLLLAAVG